MPKTFNKLAKWQNFAKSGHTDIEPPLPLEQVLMPSAWCNEYVSENFWV